MVKSKVLTRTDIILKSFLLLLIILTTLALFLSYYAPLENIPVYDENISPKVNAYLEPVILKSNYTDPHIDRANTYCYSFIYDYNEEYVFAHVTCRQYAWQYYEKPQYDENGRRQLEPVPPVEIIRELYDKGSGMSSYLRLSYELDTDFKFNGYEYPEPGIRYYENATEMFQMKNIGLPPKEEMARALEELEARFHAENDNAPIPAYI